MIQRHIVLMNIQDAREQLEAIEKSLLDPDYEEVELKLDLAHAYHHLNYAWNTRNEPDAVLERHADEDFARWSRYPSDDIKAYP
jgi:hypothetical protein